MSNNAVFIDNATQAMGDIAGSFISFALERANKRLAEKELSMIEAQIEVFKLQGIERKWLQRKNWKKLQGAFEKHKLTGENAGECFHLMTTINIETATFINNTMESYNNSVIDSIFTPVQKLKKFYKLYAVDQQKQYGPKCLKLIARIERWK